MNNAPLPPHERVWRHPSEIAAAERARLAAESAPNNRSHIKIVGTASVSLLAVMCFLVLLAPTAVQDPVEAVTTSVVRPRTNKALGVASQTTTTLPVLQATPVGDQNLAVTTIRSLELAAQRGDLDAGVFSAVLTDGQLVRARLVYVGDNAAIVQLDRPVSGRIVTQRRVLPDEMVTLLGVTPTTVLGRDLAASRTADGVPVIDGEGYLIGLIGLSSYGSEGWRVIDISDELGHVTRREQGLP